MRYYVGVILAVGVIFTLIIAKFFFLSVRPPYPLSSVITGINFDSQIVRKATESDNWPITWGDDDKLYTAFGDGWGFEPKLSSKACLGTARIYGKSENFSGKNLGILQSKNGSCHKATGVLMINNILYLWTRRDSGRLWKSIDHGQTWKDTGITMEQPDGSFHSNHFCQFGPGYTQSRDDYIYVYGTYRKSNGNIYMFRVSNFGNSIENKSNYEYYSGLDEKGNSKWSLDIANKASIFYDSGNDVIDARVVYNSGVKRYLLTYWFGKAGGIGIFDAPEPWGPWTTVYYTDKWGEGFTFEYSFPSKWISSDGRTMYMVFSGTGKNDSFSVRKIQLTVNN